jgi:flagellar assembly protein FliH
MSGVIKQHDPRSNDSIRPMRQEIPAHTARLDPMTARLAAAEEEIERLQAALAESEVEASRLRDTARDAFEEGRQQGLAEGRKAGEERRAAALEQLEIALSAATDRLAEDIGQLERLAPMLAKAALERLVGDPGGRLEFVTDALRLQLARVDQASLVQAEVSPEDFADPADLDALPGRLGTPRLVVVLKDDLAAGEARLRLTLGGLEVGPAQQMKVLAALLDTLAEGTAE